MNKLTTKLHLESGIAMDESNIMSQQIYSQQQLIASYTGKLLRDHFGKGPESVHVSIGHRFITIYLRNFITPSERVLLEQDHELIIDQMREKLIHMMIPEISSYIEIVTGFKPREFYYDWALHNKTGMLVGICSEPISDGLVVRDQFEGKVELEQEIIKISSLAQKSPETVESYEIGSRTLVIIRKGILVRIEKELIRLGHQELLKGVKRNLEKSLLHNNSSFDYILKKNVLDCFVDWNFEIDKSVILMVLSGK